MQCKTMYSNAYLMLAMTSLAPAASLNHTMNNENRWETASTLTRQSTRQHVQCIVPLPGQTLLCMARLTAKGCQSVEGNAERYRAKSLYCPADWHPSAVHLTVHHIRPITCKHDNINKTESTQRIVQSSEKDQTMATGNVKKLCEVWTCDLWDYEQTETYRHADCNTLHHN